MARHYVASTHVNDPPPHVVAVWEDDRLTELTLSNQEDGGTVTVAMLIKGWTIAHQLYPVREEVE